KLGAVFPRVRADPALSRASETPQMNRQCSRITQDRPGHQTEFTDAGSFVSRSVMLGGKRRINISSKNQSDDSSI
ncbi:hypothetical protein M422DRAFT_29025, partial [Sphaerobolus stellatus SS14]